MNILTTSNHGDTFNPKEGADVRKYNIVKELSKYNDVIVLESNRYTSDNISLPSNIKLIYFNEHYLFNKPLSPFTDLNFSFILKVLNSIKGNTHIIQVSFPMGIVAIKLMTMVSFKRIPIVYDAHNVEGETVNLDNTIPKIIRPFLRAYIQLVERMAVNSVDHIIVVSGRDKSLFIEKYGLEEKKITIIPSGSNKIDMESLLERAEIREKLGYKADDILVIFHGTYSYPPNKEAIDSINDYIAPEFEKDGGNVRFVIAGNGVPKFNRKNIDFIGFADDIYSLLHASDIAIVPILNGGGTRLKILDYMAVGLPIVTTKKGIEGIDAEDGENAIIVDTPDEHFINSIKYLINNVSERKKLGNNARKLAIEKYDWTVIGEKLNKLYNKLVVNP